MRDPEPRSLTSFPVIKVGTWMALFSLALHTGCHRDADFFSEVAKNPNGWVYIAAREVQLKEPVPDASIRDQRLKLTDAGVLTYDRLNTVTNGEVVLAMPSTFRTSLVTSSILRAEIPENRGKVLPVVVDRKFEIQFLSLKNGRWLSTNMLKTRVVLLTSTLPQDVTVTNLSNGKGEL